MEPGNLGQQSELAHAFVLTLRATNSKVNGVDCAIAKWEGFTASSLSSSTSRNRWTEIRHTLPENRVVL